MTNGEHEDEEIAKAAAELAAEDAQNNPSYPQTLSECRFAYRRLNSQERCGPPQMTVAVPHEEARREG